MPLKEPFNGYYKQILVPAIEDAGFEPFRADEIYGTRPIIEDIFKEIQGAAALVADVTGKNPNVNYELGIAHTFGRSVVIISQSIDDIPFDYRHIRAIIYDPTETDWAIKLRNKITQTLQKIEPKKVEAIFSPAGEPVFLDKESAHKKFDFRNLLRNAKQLDTLGYSCVSLIENHRGEITKAAINGTHVRILLVNPKSEAADLMSYHSKAKAFLPDMLKTQNRIKMTEEELANSTKKPKGTFKVKYSTWIPSCSLVIFNRKSDNGILKVKVYPICYSTSIAEIAVHQVIKKQENRIWFDYFVNQYERLWNEHSCDSSKETEVEIK